MKRFHLFDVKIMARTALLVALTTLVMTTGGLARAADSTPQFGQQAGKIDAVNAKKNTVVIDDRLYYLAANVTAHNVSGGSATLKLGYSVEFNAVSNKDVNSAGTITEIWIMGKASQR